MNTHNNDKVNNEHDVGYKHLLSAKRVFIQLLRTFIKEKWIDEVDEESAELVNKSFVLADFKEKEADLVYRMKIRNQDVIFYILTEFQSTVDYQMPYRLLLYMIEIWRDFIKNSDVDAVKQKDLRLPVIIPMVLYNGTNKWTAPLEFKDYLNEAELFGDNILNYKYILLDINRYDEDILLSISNLISTVFLIDREASNIEEMIERLHQLIKTIQNFTEDEYGLFISWFVRIVVRRFPEKQQKEMKNIIDQANREEVEQMISNIGKTIERDYDRFNKEIASLEQKVIEERKVGNKEKARQVAKKLLLKGMSIESIAEVTELSVNEIKKVESGLN